MRFLRSLAGSLDGGLVGVRGLQLVGLCSLLLVACFAWWGCGWLSCLQGRLACNRSRSRVIPSMAFWDDRILAWFLSLWRAIPSSAFFFLRQRSPLYFSPFVNQRRLGGV